MDDYLVAVLKLGATRGYTGLSQASALLAERLAPRAMTYAYDFSVHWIGETMVWALPLKSVGNLRRAIGLVHHAIKELAAVQTELLSDGVILRGQVTVGRLVVTGNGITGTALTRAATVSGIWSGLPRVVIDPEALRLIMHEPLLRAASHTAGQEFGYVTDLLGRGDDGAPFVNYIGTGSGDGARQEIVQAALDGAGADDAATDPELRSILWLATQHNRVSDENLRVIGPMIFSARS